MTLLVIDENGDAFQIRGMDDEIAEMIVDEAYLVVRWDSIKETFVLVDEFGEEYPIPFLGER
jgi:hypothetical protein